MVGLGRLSKKITTAGRCVFINKWDKRTICISKQFFLIYN